MTLITAAKAVYDNLLQAEADYAALGALDGMSETAEYIALGKSISALHDALNDLRKMFGIPWVDFLSLINPAPSGITTYSVGAGAKDN